MGRRKGRFRMGVGAGLGVGAGVPGAGNGKLLQRLRAWRIVIEGVTDSNEAACTGINVTGVTGLEFRSILRDLADGRMAFGTSPGVAGGTSPGGAGSAGMAASPSNATATGGTDASGDVIPPGANR